MVGYGESVLDIIKRTNTHVALEPLYVAVREIIGQDVTAPMEISEVARDIVQKIRASGVSHQGFAGANLEGFVDKSFWPEPGQA